MDDLDSLYANLYYGIGVLYHIFAGIGVFNEVG